MCPTKWKFVSLLFIPSALSRRTALVAMRAMRAVHKLREAVVEMVEGCLSFLIQGQRHLRPVSIRPGSPFDWKQPHIQMRLHCCFGDIVQSCKC